MRIRRSLIVLGALLAALAVPVAAQGHEMTYNAFGSTLMPLGKFNTLTNGGFVATQNMHPLSFNEREGYIPRSFGTFASDLAFWGDKAYQGSWDGFRILDISSPAEPIELINYRDCADPAGQGDVVIWDNILVRTWDNNAGSGRTCDGEAVPVGFEGVHIFDVSNPADPDLLSSVDLACGSHTASGFPDVDNDRFILYSTPSSGVCDGIDIIEIPLSAPESPVYHGLELAGEDVADANGFACHDTGIILGSAMKAACAGGIGFAVWSIGGEDGGTFTDPEFLYNKAVGHGVSIGHSAAFSYDGDTILFGHEPGGGTQARCQETGVNGQTDDMKTLFFFDTDTGEETGKWTMERPQTADENCTIHNYNVVPTKKRDVLVHGSYQSGIGVLDFTDRSNPVEIAYADPAPLPRVGTNNLIQIAGDWSSYWYNGFIYESDIGRGLMTWNLSSSAVAGAAKFPYSNPQTQPLTID